MEIGSYFIGAGCRLAIASLTFAAVSGMMTTAAIAQDSEDFPVVQGVRFGEVANEFERTFFSQDPDFYEARTFTGQLKRIFGPFPDNTIVKDSKDVHRLYYETFYKQMNAGPIIRTIDLPSPFQSSLRTLPPSVVAAPVPVVEPPIVVTPAPVAPPVTPVAPQRPVPGLW